jgi:hypothetical protein
MNQGLLTTTEYGKIHDQLAAKYTAAGTASKLFEKDTGKISEVMAVVESRAVGMSASMGMVGAVLQVIGPAGQNFATGQHDKVMASRYGARPQARSR